MKSSALSQLLVLHYSFYSFSHQHQLMIFCWSLSDSNSPLVSGTILCILADINCAVVWMVLFPSPSVLDQSFDDCTESIDYNLCYRNFHFPLFFQFPSKVHYSFLFPPSFNFILFCVWTVKSTIRQVPRSLWTFICSSRLAYI